MFFTNNNKKHFIHFQEEIDSPIFSVTILKIRLRIVEHNPLQNDA